jgi:ergothioneine biosynthesis protein EgtB
MTIKKLLWCAMPDPITPDNAALLQRYRSVRAASMALLPYLSAEDCCVQAMPQASPFKWHLAHTSWFFETFILARAQDYVAFDPAYRYLFNSYYNGIGAQYPRLQRGMLTRPGLTDVLAYRAHVDAGMASLIALDTISADLLELGLQHEQQHQELMLTDIKALLALNPLQPALLPDMPLQPSAESTMRWVECSGGLVEIGHAEDGFCFDNELPVHRVFLPSYSLASRLVSNADYLAFIDDGAYDKPALWLSEGWDWVQREQIRMPLYWQQDGAGQWQVFGLQGRQLLRLQDALSHVSFFEAEAYARWAGARLPTEAEWEHAARSQSEQFDDLSGRCWQWTASSYSAYPGFIEAAGAVGEYNGKFMINQMVLRGSSAATPEAHARVSYRNFFPTDARWQMTGVRLAR